jgi:hypothetical protein
MGWDVDGIREDSFRHLCYNAASETLVARFERSVEGSRTVSSIYVRARDAIEYTKLFGPDDVTSAETLVTAEAVPVAFFNVLTRCGTGSNWAFVARADLRTSEVNPVLNPAALARGHEGPAARAWVAKILSASADGASLLCVIGRQRSVDDEQPGRLKVDYTVSRVELLSQSVETITLLRNIFF